MNDKDMLGMIYKFRDELRKKCDKTCADFDYYKAMLDTDKTKELLERESTINEIIDDLNDILDEIEKDMKEEEEVAEVLSIKITDAEKEEKLIEFSKELEHLINKYSIDSMANMADYKITEMVIEKIKYLI